MLKNKYVSMFDRIEDIVLVAMFAAMVAIIFLQVIMRYVFNHSLSWSEELGKFLFVWITWLGISIGARRGEHITITMVVNKLSPKARRYAEVLSNLILIVVSAFTAWYSFTLVTSQSHVHFAGIKISMSWGYMAVLVGCVLMCVRCAIGIYASIKGGEE